MQSFGKIGEDEAAQFLIKNNYQILDRNYRYKRAEIDIICRKGDLLVFVEVKSRSSAAYGLPETFVSKNQQKSIIGAAEQYIHEMEWSAEVRFDIISIIRNKDEQELEHFKDAFY